MLIMLIRWFVRSFVCRQRVLVGQWPAWPSSAVLLREVSGRSAAMPRGPRVSQMIRPPAENLTPVTFLLSAGGGVTRGADKRSTIVVDDSLRQDAGDVIGE